MELESVIRKIIFIEPKSPNLHIFSQFPLPRLGVFILGAIVKEKGWNAEVIVEQFQKIKFEKIRNVDRVEVSTITPTAPRAYAIADRIRSLGIPVIIGGPHVTFLLEEVLVGFLESLDKGKYFSEVPNLSYQAEGKSIHNPVKP